MPVVTATLIEGYDEDTRDALSLRLTHAVKATIDAPMDGITVILHEVAPAGYMRGGVRRRPGPPKPAGATVVRAFLDAMEARDLSAAARYLADDFVMEFPGGARFTALEDLVAWAKDRYRSVTKSYERIDEAPSEVGMIVYCHGTLAGEWPDGTPFEGVRFIDRFTVAGGKLVDQKVWNDLAEARTRTTGR